MSFSSQVKAELCREGGTRKCCARAEAYGALLFCQSFNAASEIKLVTSSEAFAQRLPPLFQKAFKVTFDQLPAPGEQKQMFLLTDPLKLSAVREPLGYDAAGSLAHHINFAVLEEDHCRTAFLRGAFLAGGSMSDPEKSYHLEFTTTHYNVSREFAALLPEVGFSPKQTTRHANYVTYFKNSATIEDFLTAIGAPVAAMELMNAKLEKHLRGSVNRRVNCDTANVDKAVDAAQDQVEAIRRLETSGGLAGLPDKLREAAALRVEHPDLTLTELAALCTPPVTKSCLNHRLRKLMELSRESSE